MTAVPVVRSRRASQDIEQATAYYLTQAGVDIALKFVEALENTSLIIARNPHLGSPRYAHALNLTGLRHRKLKNFPWFMFYVTLPYYVEVVRVLDARRDIPATLLDDKPS